MLLPMCIVLFFLELKLTHKSNNYVLLVSVNASSLTHSRSSGINPKPDSAVSGPDFLVSTGICSGKLKCSRCNGELQVLIKMSVFSY